MDYDYELDVPEEGRIKIGDDITLSFFRFSDTDLRIGCKVPKNILILRQELYNKNESEKSI